MTFLEYVVDNLGIPPISVGEDGQRGKGGLSLMAWSAGNMYVVPVLAYANEVEDGKRRKLEPYFRKLFLFGKMKFYAAVFAEPLTDASA